jgi:RNA polymerase sigma factor (sigma-70 family)
MTALRIRSESTLRSRAARGDAAAFAVVYERHHQALYRYCRSILRHDEDAQDALQSTMARAFAALQDEQRDFELRPWLFRIAHNEAISILRRRRETGELDELPALGELEDRVAEREELRLLQLDLADLPERQRAALILRELNGLSHQEIGVVLELSTGAVKQAIFDARSALFSFREGREMACHDIRRMLSDGDGRVLRGRGVRGHLRSCPDCRRFKADIEQRPKALRALAPPLPIGGAAALLAQRLGGGATAAKLLASVAIAGGGTTLAVEMRHAREPAPAAASAERTPSPRPTAEATGVAAKTPAPVPATRTVSAPPRGEAKGHAKAKPRGKAKGHERTAAAKGKALGHTKAPGEKAIGRSQAPGQVKKWQPNTTGKASAPGQIKKRRPHTTGKATAPGQIKRTTPKRSGKATTPVQAHRRADTGSPATPPGQAKQDEPKTTDHGNSEKSGKDKGDK